MWKTFQVMSGLPYYRASRKELTPRLGPPISLVELVIIPPLFCLWHDFDYKKDTWGSNSDELSETNRCDLMLQCFLETRRGWMPLSNWCCNICHLVLWRQTIHKKVASLLTEVWNVVLHCCQNKEIWILWTKLWIPRSLQWTP